jgi:AcrR family transcriptional regulator
MSSNAANARSEANARTSALPLAPTPAVPTTNGLGKEHEAHGPVAEIQRARMLNAMIEMVSEHGAGNVSVAHVVTRSGVSRRTFYELFGDREDCLLAALEDAVGRVAHETIPAYKAAGHDHNTHAWREQIRAGLTTVLALFDSDPGLARLLVVESLGAGPKALESRSRVLAKLVAVIDEGRRQARTSPQPSALAAEGVLGAVLGVIHTRLIEKHPTIKGGDTLRLVDLTGPLMGMIVLPYLGAAAARKEQERPVTIAPTKPPTVNNDPLRGLHMRLTYRTVRVLLAVAANPGSSNRTVANTAEINDQGQMSKLLARLQRLGLIENTGTGPMRGEPNAWQLTNRGKEVERVLTT